MQKIKIRGRDIKQTKLKNDSNYICSSSYLKLLDAKGMPGITLNKENKGYFKYNSSCLIEKGFTYKIKGYTLHSMDTITVKL